MDKRPPTLLDFERAILDALEWSFWPESLTPGMLLDAEPGNHSDEFLLVCHAKLTRLLQCVDWLLAEQQARRARMTAAFRKRKRGWVAGSPREISEAERAGRILRERRQRERNKQQ